MTPPEPNAATPPGAAPLHHGEYKMPGGKLVVADITLRDGVLDRVQISGDFFLEPDSALHAIDDALAGMPVGADEVALAARVRSVLGADVQMYGLSPEAIAVALRRAIAAGTCA